MNGLPGLPPPKPIPLKDRASIAFVEKGNVDVLDGAFVVVDTTGVRIHLPIGGLACLMLEPGARISHAAVALAARAGTLIVWVGEAGVRLYSAGQPGGARSDRLLWQASLAMNDEARLKIVRKMFAIRFGEAAPERRSVDQLRGIEGARVKRLYELLAQKHGVVWRGRNYDRTDWDTGDIPNRCLSAATACLYGLRKRQFWLLVTHPPLVSYTRVNRFRLFMILQIYSSSKLLFRLQCKLPVRQPRVN
jgi:CRISP-associated protein Cas1